MTARTKKLIRWTLATLAVVGIVAIAVPRETLKRTLGSLLGDASGTGECQIVVKLQYDGTRTYEYRANISRFDASDAESRPDSFRQEYLTRAKKALAEAQGYGSSTFGSDNFKIMSNVQVQSMKITEPSGRSKDIWRSAERGEMSYPAMD